MQVKSRDHVLLNAQAKAEPAEDVVTRDYYAQLPQIRVTAAAGANPAAARRCVSRSFSTATMSPG